jgi:SAM-dependent methyltransferase
MSDYRATVDALYAEAAATPMPSLCCTSTPPWKLPGLRVPQGMLDRNYGCGSTVHPRDLAACERALYVGVGGGLEALQMAWFIRRPGGVVAVDRVPAMLDVARELLAEAATLNDWFHPSFVELRQGDALELPVRDGEGDLAAPNCRVNIVTREHLDRALAEMRRALRPRGRLVLSDPVATRPIPAHLAADPRLRAECLSGALPLDAYIERIVAAGFGTLEVRSKRPYRVLDRARYGLDAHLLLDTVELVAIADPIPADGPCVFTGRTATWVGADDVFDDGKGHRMLRDVPLGVCDKTAGALAALGREELVLTGSTWHYAGDGCC